MNTTRRRKIKGACLVTIMVLSVFSVVTPVSAATTTTVSLAPSQAEINPSENATFDIVVDNADGGVGAHTTTVALANATVANITGVQLHGTPGVESVNFSADNSSVTIDAALMDTNNTGAVTVASVTVEGETDGLTDVHLLVDAVGDEGGSDYTISGTNNASLVVGDVDLDPPSITNAVATDLTDGDGTVSDGDEIEIAADVTDVDSEVGVVVANASAFGAGHVFLSDNDSDGTYDATVTVDETHAAASGSYAIEIVANDTANNFNSTQTNSLTLDRQYWIASGQLLEPDGTTPATDDLIVAKNSDRFQVTLTDSNGAYAAKVPQGELVGLTFIQGEFESGQADARDGVVDLYEFDSVNLSASTDLGSETLPSGHVLNVTVVNESGVGVENATVAAIHNGEVNVEPVFLGTHTNADGMLQFGNVPPGIEVVGNVTVGVQPPSDDDGFINQTYIRNLTVTGDTAVTITLEEVDDTPPSIANATLSDADDGDENVTAGSTVTISAEVSDDNSAVDTVVADASAFGAGIVSLTDDNGDGTYTATVTVDGANASADGAHAVTITANDSAGNANQATTNALTLDTTPPNISNAQATDLTDGDGILRDGDTIEVSADVSDGGTGVNNVVANASDFGVGAVVLTDDNGDGTYDATFTVNEDQASDAGNYTITIAASDFGTNADTAETNELELREVTSVGSGQPGFGVVVAILAILVAALFAVRRDQ